MLNYSKRSLPGFPGSPEAEGEDTYRILGIRNRKVSVYSKDVDFPKKYVVASASVCARFEEWDADLAQALSGQNLLHDTEFRSGLRSWRLEGPTTGARLGLNISKNWTLDESNTAFLEIDRGALNPIVVYCDPATEGLIAFKPQTLYRLLGYFGAHRCRGFLEVAFADAAGQEIGSARAEFGTHKGGGPQLEDYELVQVDFSPPPGALHGRVRLGHLAADVPANDDGSDLSAFIFFTRLGLFEIEDSSDIVRWRDGLSEEDLSDRLSFAARRLFIAHIDAASSNLSRAPIRLRCLHNADDEDVTIYSFSRAAKAQVTILGIEGSLLKVAIQGQPGKYCLYVDGSLAASLQGGEHATALFPLPPAMQDGDAHLIEVTDQSGLDIYARDFLILPHVMTPWDAIQRYVNGRLPGHLAPAASHRYTALQLHMRRLDRRDGELLSPEEARQVARIGYLHDVLTQGPENLRKVRPLEFPAHADPEVTIVIPVLDRFETTYACLCALLFAPTQASYEVIVVDDGSTDRTRELGELVKNLTVVRNEKTLGFIGACSRGAAIGRGRFIVFLNNDTEPTSHWLDELRHAFDLFGDVGIAGSKLLYPNGRLQEAGGIVWQSGNPWNYGRMQNPHDPRYSYARQTDYVSGAAMMIRKELWDEVGGFSPELSVAYFEDTYLAFEVRSRGYRVVFSPNSIVYHMEGASNGTSTASGVKRYQEVNRPVFKRRWSRDYRKHGKEGEAPDLEKDRGVAGRVLFVDYQTPRPDIDAGSYAAMQEIRLVQALGFKVTLVPENLAYLGRYTDHLQRMGVETIHAPYYLSLQDFLRERGKEFDAVYMTRYGVVENCIDLVRAHAPQAKVLFNLADLHFLRELRTALAADSGEHLGYALAVRERELSVIQRVDLTLSYNSVEEAVILSHTPGTAKVAKCPWVVETQSGAPPFAEREGIAFLGGYAHPPNAEAVRHFVAAVMPKLRGVLPGVTFHIYGSGVTEEIAALAGPDVIVHGYVETTTEVYHSARVFVAPLRSGAGIKGKVLGALAAGVPTVLSDLAAEGIGLERGRHYLPAGTADEWVEAIRSLYVDEALWGGMAESARRFVERHYSFEAGVEVMRAAFERVDIYSSLEGAALCARSIEEPSFRVAAV